MVSRIPTGTASIDVIEEMQTWSSSSPKITDDFRVFRGDLQQNKFPVKRSQVTTWQIIRYCCGLSQDIEAISARYEKAVKNARGEAVLEYREFGKILAERVYSLLDQ